MFLWLLLSYFHYLLVTHSNCLVRICLSGSCKALGGLWTSYFLFLTEFSLIWTAIKKAKGNMAKNKANKRPVSKKIITPIMSLNKNIVTKYFVFIGIFISPKLSF